MGCVGTAVAMDRVFHNFIKGKRGARVVQCLGMLGVRERAGLFFNVQN